MYLFNQQQAGSDAQRNQFHTPMKRLSEYDIPQQFSQYSQLGETPVPPKGLVLLDHYHFPKQADTSQPGHFVTGPIAKLGASDMNPGFKDTNDNLITDTSSTGLQTCLHKLITTQFQNYLSSKSSIAPSAGDRLRVALVDLSGTKIAQPDFAGWGSTVSMYGASSPKILALYAAYQLRMDLRNMASSQSISNGNILKNTALRTWKFRGVPNLEWLFNISKWAGNPNALDFSPEARNAFRGIMHNEQAGDLIIKVGFPFIASVVWQSGLFHPSRRGLWLTSSYGKGQWENNPIKGVQSANITALSAATYFTLLAQGRLVDGASSSEMKTWLRGGCVTWLFPEALGLVASKCGIWSDYLHDCALIVRDSIRYVVVGLTRTRRSEDSKYTQLFQELDKLIVQNNQTPRPGC
jgi:hypothetical protein